MIFYVLTKVLKVTILSSRIKKLLILRNIILWNVGEIFLGRKIYNQSIQPVLKSMRIYQKIVTLIKKLLFSRQKTERQETC